MARTSPLVLLSLRSFLSLSPRDHSLSSTSSSIMSDPRQFTSLKPYLTLPQLFSLTWLAYPILSLIFVAFRLHISSGQAADAVADAKGVLLTSCRAAEKAATSAASLPRFLAQGTNDQIVSAVNGTLNGARAALVLSLTIMQAIIEFLVDMYRSTFLCFLELVVRGSLELLIGASREVSIACSLCVVHVTHNIAFRLPSSSRTRCSRSGMSSS